MPEILGDASVAPTQDSLSQLGGSIPGSITGTDRWRNRAASRFSGLFGSNSGNGSLGKVSVFKHLRVACAGQFLIREYGLLTIFGELCAFHT